MIEQIKLNFIQKMTKLELKLLEMEKKNILNFLMKQELQNILLIYYWETE